MLKGKNVAELRKLMIFSPPAPQYLRVCLYLKRHTTLCIDRNKKSAINRQKIQKKKKLIGFTDKVMKVCHTEYAPTPPLYIFFNFQIH